jgi:hypothetical protein
MGRLSDQRRSARRPGKRERARVKNPARGSYSRHVGGAGHVHVTAGRKKFGKVARYADGLLDAHLVGESVTPKSVVSIKRPLYTVETRPPFPEPTL